MGNPALYTLLGSKTLIEDYIKTVNRHLPMIEDLDTVSNIRQSFGRSALLLSGGAMMGLKHIGVIKALHDERLLPRVISGSSVGSIIAAIASCQTDANLSDYLIQAASFDINALTSKNEVGALWYKVIRYMNDGTYSLHIPLT